MHVQRRSPIDPVVELRMAYQHLRPIARRVGQARTLDREQQAFLAQRALAHPDPASLRRVQGERQRRDLPGHPAQCVLSAPICIWINIVCRCIRAAVRGDARPLVAP